MKLGYTGGADKRGSGDPAQGPQMIMEWEGLVVSPVFLVLSVCPGWESREPALHSL